MFTYQKNDQQGAAVIQGEMTIYSAAELKDQLMLALMDKVDLSINLADVTEIDSAGIQLLMVAKQECNRSGRTLSLHHHSRAVHDAFELMGLARWFNDPMVLTRADGGHHGA